MWRRSVAVSIVAAIDWPSNLPSPVWPRTWNRPVQRPHPSLPFPSPHPGLISSLPPLPTPDALSSSALRPPPSATSSMQTAPTPLNELPALAEADQARLFQCSTCKRSFTRADHLTRHVRARKSLSLGHPVSSPSSGLVASYVRISGTKSCWAHSLLATLLSHC